jgi:hypothetical protein
MTGLEFFRRLESQIHFRAYGTAEAVPYKDSAVFTQTL